MDEEEMERELDFREKKEELIRFLESKDGETMVLATSHNDRVLARNVLVASDGLDLYFFTWNALASVCKFRRTQRSHYAKTESK